MSEVKLVGGRYQIIGLLGQGGMSTVYDGIDTRTGEAVAIKLMKPEIVDAKASMVERFIREGEVLRRLNHPNIVKMLDAVEDDDDNYVIMERVTGGDLRQLLREEGRLPIERVLEIGLDLCDALTRAHRLNVIHRDIKPGNVLIAEDGTPRLTDFGVARLGDSTSITRTGTLVGTLAYLSPEACIGEVLDARADIWAFGVMLYEMLTGYRPFMETSSAALLTAILTRPIPPLSKLRQDCPPQLVELVNQMLEKERDDRIKSIRLVGAQLEAILEGKDLPQVVDEPDTENLTPLPPDEAAPDSSPITDVQEALKTYKEHRGSKPPTGTTGRMTSLRRIPEPPKIFFSYRRGDGAAITRRIYERLSADFGEDRVTRDLDRIPTNQQALPQVLENTVADSDVLIVIIGPVWAKFTGNSNHPAIFDPNDPVRVEVETGLARDNVLVIPVLVNGADMPANLPDRLHDIVYRDTFVIRDEETDINNLVQHIHNSFEVMGAETPAAAAPARRSPLLFIGLIAALAVIAVLAIVLLSGGGTDADSFNVQTVAPVVDGQYMVLVAELEALGGAEDDVSRFIFDDLQRSFEEDVPVSQVRVRQYSGQIISEEQAQIAAEANDADVVIWGNYDGVVAELNLQLGPQPEVEPYFALDDLATLGNARVILNEPRSESLVAPVVASINTLASAHQRAYDVGLNLSILSLLQPDSPAVDGSGAGANWHRFLVNFTGSSDAALEAATAALDLAPDNPIAYLGRSLTYQQRRQLVEAEQDIQTGIALAPEGWVFPYVTRAQHRLMLRNDPAGAIEDMSTAIEGGIGDWLILFFRGASYYLLEDYERAQADIDRVLEIDPENNLAYTFAVALALRDADLTQALDLIEASRSRFPDPSFSERLMSAAYGLTAEESSLIAINSAFGNMTLFQWGNVLRDTELSIATGQYPDFIEPYLMQGLAHCNLGDYAAAEASYTQGLEIDPSYAVMYLLRADVRLKQQNVLGAGADVTAALAGPQAEQFQPFVPALQRGELNCENFFEADLNALLESE